MSPGRKCLLLHSIVFAVNQQLLLIHAAAASDLEWTPNEDERFSCRKALCCPASGPLLKHSEPFTRLWALPMD